MFFKERRARREAQEKARGYGEVEWSLGRTANAFAFFRASNIKPSELNRKAAGVMEAHHRLLAWEIGSDTPFFTEAERSDILQALTGLPGGRMQGRSKPSLEDYQALFRELVILAATKS